MDRKSWVDEDIGFEWSGGSSVEEGDWCLDFAVQSGKTNERPIDLEEASEGGM